MLSSGVARVLLGLPRWLAGLVLGGVLVTCACSREAPSGAVAPPGATPSREAAPAAVASTGPSPTPRGTTGGASGDSLAAYAEGLASLRAGLDVGSFRHQAALRPRDADAHAVLGGVLVLAGEDREARRALDAALALDPRNSLAWRFQGDLEASTGDLAQARAHYRKALDLAPRGPAGRLHRALAWQGEGVAALWSGDAAAAARGFRSALDQGSILRGRLLRDLAMAEELGGRTAEAERLLLQAVSEGLGAQEAEDQLGDLYLATGQPEKTLALLEKGVARVPLPGLAPALRIEACRRLGRSEEARRLAMAYHARFLRAGDLAATFRALGASSSSKAGPAR